MHAVQTQKCWNRRLAHGDGIGNAMCLSQGFKCLYSISQVLYIATTIALTFDVTHGGARHLYYLSQSEIEYATKVAWIENPLGIMALLTAKISVAFLILRLIGPSTVWRKWSLYVSIILNFIFAVLACILTFVQCNPPRALWEAPSQVPGAKCWNPKHQADYAIFSSGGSTTLTSGSLC